MQRFDLNHSHLICDLIQILHSDVHIARIVLSFRDEPLSKITGIRHSCCTALWYLYSVNSLVPVK